MQLIDLSQTIKPDMPVFSDSAPRPTIQPWMSHAQAAASGRYENCSCEITEVQMLTSVGTYMDSPFHFNPAGQKIHELRLEQLVLPGIVIDCKAAEPREAIAKSVLDGIDVAGKAVLFHTGWSRYWGKPQYADHPFLTGEIAARLVEGGAKLAGVDFLVIDDTQNPRRPVHVHLLHHDVLIVENLAHLDQVNANTFMFHAAPVKVEGAAAFPVRAYAVIP